MKALTPHVRAALIVLCIAAFAITGMALRARAGKTAAPTAPASPEHSSAGYEPRHPLDASGLTELSSNVTPKGHDLSLAEVAAEWRNLGVRQAKQLDVTLRAPDLPVDQRITLLVYKSLCQSYEGQPEAAYATLKQARALAEPQREMAVKWLYTLVYLQGVAGIRLGETENCVKCRGTSACIIPFDPAAVHQRPRGSRLAVRHFTEYLQQFPDDLQVRWLLNLAHITLGEYPQKVDPRYLLSLDRFTHSEFNIGKFKDISYEVGLEHFNEAGGAVMDDFNNDGLLDIVTTSFDPSQSMAFFRNLGNGHFQESGQSAGLAGQIGGLNCCQTDYNNDGYLDLFIVRGAWTRLPVRPSLLRNNGNGTFTDVTEQAGLQTPLNSNAAIWADYDNDGYLDLFVCCEQQPNRLYHNQGDGTFWEVAGPAGLLTPKERFSKGATWIDYDQDGYPDLLINYLDGSAHLFHNDRRGHFTDVTAQMGITGPEMGFSCWAFDYDNDGWPDLFASCYRRSTAEVVQGLLGQPHTLPGSRLYHNLHGQRFEDVSAASGLDQVFGAMGSNFGDLDNDGYLDLYLATGDPDLSTIIPNRLFKNVEGKRFAEITGTSGTGHLQKGHGVAMGDWDRDGNVDLFVELGGAVPADRYRNVLFQNPGHSNGWLTVKLIGKKTNRAAIGARIKVVTAGKSPQTIYRWVTSGSSFGGNPLQQTIGLGPSRQVETLEIHWPTSNTTQTFHNLAANQALEITEFAAKPRELHWTPLPVPRPSVSGGMAANSAR